MLRRSARDFLAKESSSKVVRRLMEGNGYDPALWKKIEPQLAAARPPTIAELAVSTGIDAKKLESMLSRETVPEDWNQDMKRGLAVIAARSKMTALPSAGWAHA